MMIETVFIVFTSAVMLTILIFYYVPQRAQVERHRQRDTWGHE